MKIALFPRPGIGPGPSDLQSDTLPTALSRIMDSHFPVGVTVLKLHFVCDPGSDRGPTDFQSDALPTELSRLIDSHFPVRDTVFLYIFICIKIALLPKPGIGPGTFRSSV